MSSSSDVRGWWALLVEGFLQLRITLCLTVLHVHFVWLCRRCSRTRLLSRSQHFPRLRGFCLRKGWSAKAAQSTAQLKSYIKGFPRRLPTCGSRSSRISINSPCWGLAPSMSQTVRVGSCTQNVFSPMTPSIRSLTRLFAPFLYFAFISWFLHSFDVHCGFYWRFPSILLFFLPSLLPSFFPSTTFVRGVRSVIRARVPSKHVASELSFVASPLPSSSTPLLCLVIRYVLFVCCLVRCSFVGSSLHRGVLPSSSFAALLLGFVLPYLVCCCVVLWYAALLLPFFLPPPPPPRPSSLLSCCPSLLPSFASLDCVKFWSTDYMLRFAVLLPFICCGPLRYYRTPSRHAVWNQRKLACSAPSTLLAMVWLRKRRCHRRRVASSCLPVVDATPQDFAREDWSIDAGVPAPDHLPSTLLPWVSLVKQSPSTQANLLEPSSAN